MRKLRGFTLVELLVVIGIIAVLISILLPSLAKARQHANNVMCASNLRSVGQGLLLYANEHKGKLPTAGSGGWDSIWPCQVTLQLGGDMQPTGDQWGNVRGNYASVTRCPDALLAEPGVAWNGGFHYTGNVRAMPSGQNDMINGGTSKLQAYPLATKDASSKMLMWDGGILPDFGWSAPANNQNQVWWFLTWGFPNGGTNWWADPLSNGFNADQVVPISNDGNLKDLNPTSATWIGKANRDGNNNGDEFPWSNMPYALQRYRHLGNTSCNFLFFDGHVESRKLGTVTYREMSIYPY